MRGTARTVAMVAGVSAVTLLAAACGGGDGGDDTATTAGGKTGGAVTVRGCNPQNPLIPSNTTETCGGNVLDAITAKLVHYNAETAAPENDIAEKIETSDNQNFTVTLKKGYKFHDGTDVKSKNFVDAWNYAAYGPNAQSSGYFMEPIEGFGDMQCSDDECKAKPTQQSSFRVKPSGSCRRPRCPVVPVPCPCVAGVRVWAACRVAGSATSRVCWQGAR